LRSLNGPFDLTKSFACSLCVFLPKAQSSDCILPFSFIRHARGRDLSVETFSPPSASLSTPTSASGVSSPARGGAPRERRKYVDSLSGRARSTFGGTCRMRRMKRATKEREREREKATRYAPIDRLRQDGRSAAIWRAGRAAWRRRPHEKARAALVALFLDVRRRYRRRFTISPPTPVPRDSRPESFLSIFARSLARTLEWLSLLPNRKNLKCTFCVPVDGQSKNVHIEARSPKGREKR